MKHFLAQHDLVYETAPARWLDGIPLGNGDMGAVIWGRGAPLTISLDKGDIWERRFHRPQDRRYNYRNLKRLIAERREDESREIFERMRLLRLDPRPTRLPLPQLALDFGGKFRGFSGRLSLRGAAAEGEMIFPAGRAAWSCRVQSDRNLLVFEIMRRGRCPRARAAIVREIFNRSMQASWCRGLTINALLKKWGYPAPVCEQSGACWKYYQEIPGGGNYAICLKTVESGSAQRILVSIAYSERSGLSAAEAFTTVEQASHGKPAELIRSHRVFWHAFWRKSRLHIPDAKMENLFYAELYKLACCSRPGKTPCALQGVWTNGNGEMPPWCGEYALNINVQETYWPVYASNHLELGQPLYDRFSENLPAYRRRCRDFFGFSGAHVTSGTGLRGEPVYGYYQVDFWPGAGAWVAHHFWLHWLYSRDRGFLRKRAYPFMRAFMRTYLNLVEKGNDGKYHLPLSHSPEYRENGFKAWGMDTTVDLYLMRWLASALLEALSILGVKDPDSRRWRDLLQNLAEPARDKESGLWVSRKQPLEASHRHLSHLIGIYPLGNLSPGGNADEKKLIETSLAHLRMKGTGSWTGWSFPWMALIGARARNGHLAWKMLRDYFCFIAPNTFHLNGDPRKFGVSVFSYDPMTLEAGFAYAAAVMEMLLQSAGGIIRVFPAMPSFWHDASFENLRAEGAFLVTAKMDRGKVSFVEITSECGGLCSVANPFGGTDCTVRFRSGKSAGIGGEVLVIETKKGDSFLIHPAGSPARAKDMPVEGHRRPARESNWFGLKKQNRF
ncbi:MAG: glycoside hydrolase family 95-like protein [Kiritimatiellia bacterium]